MTDNRIGSNGDVGWRGAATSVLLLGATLLFGLLLSGESAEHVKAGMELAVSAVIPSSFPFMIISDFYVAYGRAENIRVLRELFIRLFALPASGLNAFITGNVGGFPIGAKMCADAYVSGALSKDDAERLIPLSSNPSCAFIIGGVGVGMWGDGRVGILLFLSLMASTVLCGVLTRKKGVKIDFSSDIPRQNYNFVESVKKSGISSIGIISFISLFSVVLGIIKKRVKNALLAYPFFALLEVTSAVKEATQMSALPPTLRLTLCAFSLGFGGACVGMQSAIFTSSCGLKMRKYYLVKLLQGVLSASIASLLYQI